MKARTPTLGLLFAALVGCGEVAAPPDPQATPAPGARDAGHADAPPRPVDAGPLDAGARDAAPRDAAPRNRAPVISDFSATPDRGRAPLEVRLAWAVADPDGDPLTCALSIDGAPDRSFDCATATATTRVFEAPVEAQVVLRVTDDAGGHDEAMLTVLAERTFELPTYLQGGFAQAGAAVPDLEAVACQVTVTATAGDDVTAALQEALRIAEGQAPLDGHCLVQLPAGRLSLTGSLRLGPGVILRGAGAERTRIGARMPSATPVIAARGGAAELSYEGEAVRGLKGQDRLTVTSTLAAFATARLAGGTRVYGEVSIDNDPTKFPSEWARPYSAFGIGQVFEVVGVDGLDLRLDRALNEPYASAGLARRLELRTSASITERVGVADLTLVREDDGHAGTIHFDRTAQAFLLRVRLEDTGWAHLHVDRSLSCTARHSHFEGAHRFGGGGQGYGVNLRHHTTGCLVEDNTFRDLRHAMILSVGTNGSVIAYNYSEDSHDDIGWLKADISVHGHYVHMNLIEGNVVEKIHVSDWWGPTPFHTVFANRVSRGGIFVDDRSEDCALIDNITDADFLLEAPLKVHGSVRDVLCVANVDPAGAPVRASHSQCDDENDEAIVRERPRPPSLYREAPIVDAQGRLPAQVRFQSGHPVPVAR